MAGTGFSLVVEARAKGLNPALIAGIAGTESSYGWHGCYGNRRNAFGLSSCTSGWRVPYFPTWRSAYRFMARFLTERWPHARTPYDFYGYAAATSSWATATSRHMNELGFPATVRWSWR